VRRPVRLFLAVALFTSACGQSPSESFAHLVDQVASWSAAGRYAIELHARREVPDAYLKQVLSKGSDALQQLRSRLSKSKDIPAAEQNAAVSLTADLQALFTADQPDEAKLAAIEMQLRGLAETSRKP
jgi:hypothetical protein